MTTLIATSVVRGSQQGDSHGGVFLIDLDGQRAAQTIDWDKAEIDWTGRGWDRGLRGIAFDGDIVYIAASDELFAYTPDFELIASYRSPHLKHCHEIFSYKRRLYLTSTGYDSILGFDLDSKEFSWGMHFTKGFAGCNGMPFLPGSSTGPPPDNQLHRNNVYCYPRGLDVSGLHSGGLLIYTGKEIRKIADLPEGTHNARPFKDGVLFNDTRSDVVRFLGAGKERVFEIPSFPPAMLTHTDLDDTRVARQGFGRGLCTIGGGLVAAGSSPSTITLHDFESMKTTLTINLTMDVRNAIHGLEVWPF